MEWEEEEEDAEEEKKEEESRIRKMNKGEEGEVEGRGGRG